MNSIKRLKFISLYIYLILEITLVTTFETFAQNTISDTKYLVDAQLIKSFSPARIKRFTSLTATIQSIKRKGQDLSFMKDYYPRLQYQVNAYRITYNTVDVEGNSIIASGALLIPQTLDSLPLVSHQHGTLRDASSASSFLSRNSEIHIFGILFSSMGNILVSPDYLGYGASDHINHPYEHAPSLATASRDMIRAAQEFCTLNRINLNQQLFLLGYSEGGTATMALHRLLEEKHTDEFSITASAIGGGAYDKLGFAKVITKQNQNLSFMNIYIWVIEAYNNIYKINRPFTDYFQQPHSEYIASTPIDKIDSTKIPTNPQKLFTSNFLDGIINESDTAFVNALKDNKIYDWKPEASIRLFHGTEDNFVYPQNSEIAFTTMRNCGAINVEYIKMEGENHITGRTAFFRGMVEYFDTFQ